MLLHLGVFQMTTPFKQKIMAAAAFDDDTAKTRAAYHHLDFPQRSASQSHHVGAYDENARILPLLTRLVDEVEALKAALERAGVDMGNAAAVNVKFRIAALERIDTAVIAHQKRWEDLK